MVSVSSPSSWSVLLIHLLLNASTNHGFKVRKIEWGSEREVLSEGSRDAHQVGGKLVRAWESDGLQAKPEEVIRLILDVQERALLFLCQQRASSRSL